MIIHLLMVAWAAQPSAVVRLPPMAMKDEVFVASPCDAADAFCDVVAIGSDRDWSCTGVLVAPGVVLTAAHCLPATRVGIGHRVDELVSVHSVTKTSRHPHLDVALLVVDDFPEVPVHSLDASGAPPSGQLRAIGFGADGPFARGAAGIKRGVYLNAPSGWGCSPQRSAVTGCVFGFEMALRGDGSKDTCDGDSGGPVFTEKNGSWQLTALVSRPMRHGRVRCGQGGIYTRIDRLIPWLMATVDLPPDEENP